MHIIQLLESPDEANYKEKDKEVSYATVIVCNHRVWYLSGTHNEKAKMVDALILKGVRADEPSKDFESWHLDRIPE